MAAYPLPSCIELRNVRTSAHMSRGTSCFTATVYIDGVKAGEVENRGDGGAHYWHPQVLERAVQAIADPMPDWEVPKALRLPGQVNSLTMTAELLINLLVEREDAAKRLRRMLKTSVVFLRGMTLLQRKPAAGMANGVLIHAMAGQVKAERGVECVLNLMPFDAALSTYLTYGG